MEFQELRYQHLTVPELENLDSQLDKQIWDTMDLLHALQIGRSVIRNTIKERHYGTAE